MSSEELKTLSKVIAFVGLIVLGVFRKEVLSTIRYLIILIKRNPIYQLILGYFGITIISNFIYYYVEFSKTRLHFLFDFPLYVISKTTLFVSAILFYLCVLFLLGSFINFFFPQFYKDKFVKIFSEGLLDLIGNTVVVIMLLFVSIAYFSLFVLFISFFNIPPGDTFGFILNLITFGIFDFSFPSGYPFVNR